MTTWPDYRSRYLPAMTRAQIEALPERESALVLLTTGAVEQHGPHLPVGVDALMGQAWLQRVLPRLPEKSPVYVAPPVQVGKSNEHQGFPGTLIVSRKSLRVLLLATARQLAKWGFRRLAFINTHGGNLAVLRIVVRELNADGFETSILRFSGGAKLTEREAAYGIHAGEVEASWMADVIPDRVDLGKANCCWIGSTDQPGVLRPEFAPATYAWKTLDISPTGTMGDATQASTGKGAAWMETGVERLRESIMEKVSLRTGAG